jgi:hypothetical protein
MVRGKPATTLATVDFNRVCSTWAGAHRIFHLQILQQMMNPIQLEIIRHGKDGPKRGTHTDEKRHAIPKLKSVVHITPL